MIFIRSGRLADIIIIIIIIIIKYEYLLEPAARN